METNQDRQIGRVIRQSARTLSGAGVVEPRMEAELLAGHVLGKTRTQVLCNPEQDLSPSEMAHLETLITRRGKREPFQYLVGKQEFWGRDFIVNPEVLIPRGETEHLIEAVLSLFPDSGAPLRGADIGTGSGCLAVTLAALYPAGKFTAVDCAPGALAVARENARLHGVDSRIEFAEGDLLNPVRDGKGTGDLDLVVSNPPYVPSDQLEELQPEVGRYEPRIALDGGSGGLDFYPRIIRGALEIIRPGGYLLLEIGQGQQNSVLDLAAAGGWQTARVIQDLQGIPRTLVFQKKDTV